MTLIAAFKPSGFPTLLGDFLITRGGVSSAHRKKVHLVSPNFAVAWTGHLLAARQVLGGLKQEFGDRRVTQAEVEGFLQAYPVEELGELHVRLVGWVIENEPFCFRWNSGYPAELFTDSYLYDGSGDAVFERMAGSGKFVESEEITRENHIQAINFSLALACDLISDELRGRRFEQLGFGYGYEILMHNGTYFDYLDDILYLSWDVHFDDEQNITEHNCYGTFFKYREISGLSIIQTIDLEKRHTKVAIITPVWDRTQKQNEIIRELFAGMRDGVSFPVRSKYYCIFFNLISPDGSVERVSAPILPFFPNPPITVHGEFPREEIEVNTGLFEQMYRMIKSG